MKETAKFPFPFAATAILMAAVSTAGAATFITSTFTSAGLSSDVDIDVTGPNVVHWGYYNQSQNFLSTNGTVDNKIASSGIGAVTVTPGAISNATANTISDVARFTMTFDDGTSPAIGTVEIGAGLGAWGGTEDNAATLTFNDLGAGTHTVRFFAGHTSNDRIFDMDYTVTAADLGGGFTGNTESNAIVSGLLHSTYQLVFSTTDPSADLTLQFNSKSGSAGSGWIGGYVVETVPEPSSAAVLGLAGIACLLRRRK